MNKIKVLVPILVILIAGSFFFYPQHHSPISKSNQTKTPNTQRSSVADNFNKQQYSVDDPTSIWIVVNKKRPLNPVNYVPSDLVVPNLPLRVPGNESMQLRQPAAQALETLFTAAKTDGVPLMVSSGYRSYNYQVNLYSGYVKSLGQTVADTQSARPGYSEHQTGLAVDVEPLNQQCDIDVCFADLPGGKWIAQNAWQYGFLLRYPKGYTDITGYQYEPWHLRYIGTELAAELHKTNTFTLEQFFNLPGGPNY